MAEFVNVAKTAEIAPGQAKMVEANDKKIALFNVDGSFYAIEDTCTHAGGPLSEGELDGPRVTCPWHRSIFNVTTGEVLGPPAGRGVTRYNTRVEGDDVGVEV
ncbi:MAG TPA: non-heme iron oxygenase ferredoxin subunit [Pyrinomonadaceae bacterium]|nr:non-heme iron oxygenase ferredoxin subunit [Pyrinomonadaceae bacterium]